jgi:hypothetical protein
MIVHDDDDDGDGEYDDNTVTYHNDLKPQPFRLSAEAFNHSCNNKML